MKNIFLVPVVLLISICLSAQDQTVKNLQAESGKTIKKAADDTIPKTWKKGGLYSLSIGQGSLNNWAAGGDDFSLSANSMLSLFAFYKKNKNSWDNTLDINWGYVKTTSLGSRKNDDRLDLLSKYGYALSPKFDLASLFNFRSQFFKGYSYNDNIRTLSSNFLAPAYILLGVGFNYKPTKHLSVYLSPLTVRWVIVKDDSLSAKGAYGVDPGKKSINEIGAFATISYLKEFNKSVTYIGRLDLFSNYKRKPQNVDVYMTNILSAKLGKVFSVTWSVDMIYDDDVRLFGPNKTSAALQLKSIIGIGLQVRI
jgi:Protein of unknown function (DUF3078)